MSEITENEVELQKCADNVSFQVESDSVMSLGKIEDFDGITLFPDVCKNTWK